MKMLLLSRRLQRYLRQHRLTRKFEKQKLLFEKDYRHPSLHTEMLEPKHLRIYSFRIDIQYRAIFIINEGGDAEIIDINNHYR